MARRVLLPLYIRGSHLGVEKVAALGAVIYQAHQLGRVLAVPHRRHRLVLQRGEWGGETFSLLTTV